MAAAALQDEAFATGMSSTNSSWPFFTENGSLNSSRLDARPVHCTVPYSRFPLALVSTDRWQTMPLEAVEALKCQGATGHRSCKQLGAVLVCVAARCKGSFVPQGLAVRTTPHKKRREKKQDRAHEPECCTKAYLKKTNTHTHTTSYASPAPNASRFVAPSCVRDVCLIIYILSRYTCPLVPIVLRLVIFSRSLSRGVVLGRPSYAIAPFFHSPSMT